MVDISNFIKIAKHKLSKTVEYIINLLVIADIIAIVYMFFTVSPVLEFEIILFDLSVCTILLLEFSIRFIRSKSKKEFMKENWIDLVASIPFDLILPTFFNSVRFLRLFRILKLLRVMALARRYFKGLNKFVKNTSFDKVIIGIVISIVAFTVLIFLTDPSIGLFDSFWFVIVTLTTVGYGDITPTTFNGKVLSILLIIVGVFIFSTITGAVSSIFTDRLLEIDDESDEETLKQTLDEKIKPLSDELKELKQQNAQLKEEIIELKELIKKE